MKILQISHGYNAPFLGVSNHYETMLSEYGEVSTLYLSGAESTEVRKVTKNAQILFWGLNSKSLKGMKVRLICKLYKFIRDENFDLVICHRYKAIYMTAVTQLLGLKFKQVGVIHGFGDFKRKGRQLFLSLFKERLLLLGVSNSIRDDIRESMPSFPSNKIRTLYNAIDVDIVESKQLSRTEARKYFKLEEDKFIIANVGRLHPDKDQSTLICAFALFNKNVPQSQLLILGSGRLENQLKQLSIELGVSDQVSFLGQVDNAVNYYAAFDLFVLTSDKEPFGLVLLEAMVAKVPVLASNCGGAKEVVSDVGGLFEFGDSQALNEAMTSVFNVDNEKQVQRAYEKLREEYSFATTEKKLASLLILKGRKEI